MGQRLRGDAVGGARRRVAHAGRRRAGLGDARGLARNLAVLVGDLGLGEALAPRLPGLARRCFEWICRRQRGRYRTGRPGLRMVKNAACAWRQMVFFLALAPGAERDAFVTWARERLGAPGTRFEGCLRPALGGLTQAVHGTVPRDASDARLFLGWTTELHWLLG